MRPSKQFVPFPFTYHQEIELVIDTVTNLGQGLGRINNWVVMVPFTIPGEKIKARVYKNHKNYSEADLIEVIVPSPNRTLPQCPLFTQCGGCQYQHIQYDKQLEIKTQQVKELLEKGLGQIVEVSPAISSPKQYHYRSKITPHFPKPIADKSFPIGFLRYGSSHHYVDVPQCPIATEPINAKLPEARAAIQATQSTLRKGGTLLLRQALEGVVQDPNQLVSEKVNDTLFQFKAGDFFQNNPFILPKLVEYVIQEAQTEGIEFLVDAYCGSGMFCLSASKYFKYCYGVEVNESAIQWAKKNAQLNQIQNCEFVLGSAEAIFQSVQLEGDKTSVVIDPPRKGSDELFLSQLLSLKPKRIVYVACDPATQSTGAFLQPTDTSTGSVQTAAIA